MIEACVNSKIKKLGAWENYFLFNILKSNKPEKEKWKDQIIPISRNFSVHWFNYSNSNKMIEDIPINLNELHL